MKSAFAAFCILIAFSSHPFAAQALNQAVVMKEYCQAVVERKEGTTFSYCTGFVGAILYLGRRLEKPEKFCVPADVSIDDAAGVFVDYLNANANFQPAPEELAVRAFSKAWPCK